MKCVRECETTSGRHITASAAGRRLQTVSVTKAWPPASCSGVTTRFVCISLTSVCSCSSAAAHLGVCTPRFGSHCCEVERSGRSQPRLRHAHTAREQWQLPLSRLPQADQSDESELVEARAQTQEAPCCSSFLFQAMVLVSLFDRSIKKRLTI